MDIGDTVPADLATTLGNGSDARLGDWRGRWLVLYFYPKDSTPGCTTEGGDFNARLDAFHERNAAILGVSRDSVASHARFAEKQGYRFDLASDPDETLCRAFDVIREKNMYGRKVLGIERSTFLIGPDGRIVQAWRKVKVAGHADAVLAALDGAR
ncbi:peroxiredoxin [Coralloluteibacterium stylophorae]|uniref:thioredoxin-dependent peroxiredoxin n=1 Tax=Coralloluteibacterium stylophorae TaxID=1776034 RepID=A0A8J7VY16_9GAMM|nr:peroxiredoxin [Coralloluteibacterium stylophorae]MBS7458705.1 peroxiredoxin [Coralloluteibacterium stylophorae]